MDEQNYHKQLTRLEQVVFIALQLLDIMTTVIFLHLGVKEVNWLINGASNPVSRMFLLKGLLCAYILWLPASGVTLKRFHRIMQAGIALYLLVVAWNLFAIMRVTGAI